LNFIPYGRQSISDDDVAAVVAVLRSDYLTQGPAVEAFEKALTDYLGSRDAVAVANGTAALHLASLALGVGPGDAVVVPALTFAATANAVLYCGATPVFADIDPATLTISPASVERALAAARKQGLRPKAIYPVHFAGLPADLATLRDLAAEQRLAIVEDACHALGAEYRASASEPFRKVGSGNATAMQCWSFHPVKHVATGEGGAVTTDDPKLAAAVRKLRTHGITKDASQYVCKPTEAAPWYHEMQELGFNYRLCDIQAALGASQMRAMAASIVRRRAVADLYRRELAGLPWLGLPSGDTERGRHAYHLFPLRIDFKALGTTRTAVMQKLSASKIGTQVHYIPVYAHPFYQANGGRWLKDDCRETEAFYEQALSIPMYAAMTDADVTRVCAAIRALARP
jgi:UDP-4-amino-4,6-dideoxy-N-acetyl-beta-L-altrosamine transaminase